MSFLDDANQYLQQHFPDDWTNGLVSNLNTDNTDDDIAVSNFKTDLAGRLDVAAERLFESLNFSVLSGEYVTNLTGYRLLLDDLEKQIGDIAANMDITGYPNMTLVGQELFQTNFHYSIKQVIKSYRSLFDFVNRHLVYKANTSQIFYLIRKDDDRPLDSAAKKLGEVFQLNIKLAKIDHGISFSKIYFTNLILIQDELKKLAASNNAAYILSKKCDFLLYKISFRLKQSQKDYLYAIDFNYSTIQPATVIEFSKYNDIINGHYENGFKPQSYEQRLDAALQKLDNPTSLELDDYHALIKYFKDENINLERLRQLRVPYKEYRNRIYSTSGLYDKKALDISFCYLENNILSLELDTKQLTLENWKTKLKEYIDRAENFQNKNFFPYYKIIKKFLSNTITQQFFDPNYDLKVIESLIDDFKSNLSKLGENVGICEETDYLSYQGKYTDCITLILDNAGVNRECFVSSSFVLPINYKEFREELEQFKADLNKFNSMFEIQKMIDVDRKDVKIVKDEIQRTDKRNIEILSIFAALVMFVSNEIQIFTKMPNIATAAVYTLFFAFGLGVFVLMIWFITRPEGKKTSELKPTHWFCFGFMSVGLIAAIIYIFTIGSPKTDQLQLGKLQHSMDSLKKRNSIATTSISKPLNHPQSIKKQDSSKKN